MNYSGNTSYRPDNTDASNVKGDHKSVEMVVNHIAGRRSPAAPATYNQTTRDSSISCSPQHPQAQGAIRVEVSKRRISGRGESPQRVIPIVHSKSPSGISLHSNMASPSVNTTMMRTVPIQSTNYRPNDIQQQQHGMVNNQVQLAPQMVIAPQNSVQNKTIFISNSGSNYSSPRSSTGSYDSKGSSPRTSIVNPSQPTYDYQRRGSARSSIVSSRSSISFDSKQSSPRTSVTGLPLGVTLEKYPNQQQQHSPNVNLNHTRIVHEDNRVSVTIRGHPAMLDRYNEPAPPPPYNAKMMANAGMYLMPSGSSPPWYGQKPQVISNASGDNVSFKFHHVSPNQIPPNVPHKAPTKLRGLHYEVIPPKRNGPSDAEKKLAVLTKKLESEMSLSATDNTTLPNSPQTKPSSNPPPYYGPHITGPNINCYSTAPDFANSEMVQLPQSAGATLASSRLDISSNSLNMALPVVVTPPHPRGPTEAEKKLEALTQELESQMEQNPQGEYYGRWPRPFVFYHFLTFV